ncbi:MAG: hypothetical protein A2156_15725 [Deltaproteobacteria bacterium RBG_16_48_10]|nr:MAG: hypothetical protein A2156_15725 [Deltaproteobacteria bacterium RBG_16_48_10]
MEKEKKAVLIHPDDHVAVVLEDVGKGEGVRYWDGRKLHLVIAQGSISKGHKVAVRSIRPKAKVKKYGIPIGRAMKQIKRGQLVHIDNLASFVR